MQVIVKPQKKTITITAPTAVVVKARGGPQGPQGAQGVQGIQGVAGSDGAPGSDGPPIVDTGSFSSPTSVTTTITVPADQRARLFLQGSGAPAINPTISNGSGTKELYLFGVHVTNWIELNSASNLLLSGKWVGSLGSFLSLQWVGGLNKWVEVSRNEI